MSLGSASIASASTPPSTPAAKAVSSGVLQQADTASFSFSVNGTFAENLQEFNISDGNQLHIVRYPGAHSGIDSWLASQNDPREPRPYSVSVNSLDFDGRTVKKSTFTSPVITKVETSGSTQVFTITYDRLIIS
ncbi:hypothetical protein WJM95_34775 [Streptomyces sp. f51]|uniref:hypothetical protein n=1 Tax=Streptomyces sp. f51 TaxID=1827742 RepID=UPI0030D0240E